MRDFELIATPGKHDPVYKIKERRSGHFIASSSDRKTIEQYLHFLERGGAFGGFTPGYVVIKLPDLHQRLVKLQNLITFHV